MSIFFKALYQFSFLPVVCDATSSIWLPTFGMFGLYKFSHSNGCVVISYYSYNLNLPNDWFCWASFSCACLPFVYFLWWSFEIFCPFFFYWMFFLFSLRALCILDMSYLLNIYLANILCQAVACLFVFVAINVFGKRMFSI